MTIETIDLAPGEEDADEVTVRLPKATGGPALDELASVIRLASSAALEGSVLRLRPEEARGVLPEDAQELLALVAEAETDGSPGSQPILLFVAAPTVSRAGGRLESVAAAARQRVRAGAAGATGPEATRMLRELRDQDGALQAPDHRPTDPATSRERANAMLRAVGL